MRCRKFLILSGLVYSLRDCGVRTLLSTQLQEAAAPDRPVVWSVGVGCQPLCICKSLGNGSWMGAGSLFVCILQSFSPGRTSLPLLISDFNAIILFGTASVLPWHLLCCSRCSFISLKEKSTRQLYVSSCFLFSYFTFLLYPLSPASPLLLLQFVIYILENAF